MLKKNWRTTIKRKKPEQRIILEKLEFLENSIKKVLKKKSEKPKKFPVEFEKRENTKN